MLILPLPLDIVLRRQVLLKPDLENFEHYFASV